MFGRPNLYTSYEQENQILPTWTQKVAMGVFALVLLAMPLDLWLTEQIPFVRFLGDDEWLPLVNKVFVFAIATLGLNILAGVAGQVSLGHAFFMGVGAVTAVFLGGHGSENLHGLGLPIWVWLPGAGIGAGIVGVVVSPVAVRLRGLYLAIVTLGLVFLGIHFGNTKWGAKYAGAPGLGRKAPDLDLRIWKEETPLVNIEDDGRWLWFDISDKAKTYFLLLVVTAVLAVVAKNLIRTRTGRAFQAIRDRDIAAEVMGIPEFKYKLIAFGISSFYAGIAGALFSAALSGQVLAYDFGLFLSVEFIAVLLIGGAGTTSGPLVGAFFVVMIPEFVETFTKWLDKTEGGVTGKLADVVLTSPEGDFGVIFSGTQTPGWQLNVFDWNIVLFGVLIIVFLIFEPLGLYGVWVRVRNYWKRWPFSY